MNNAHNGYSFFNKDLYEFLTENHAAAKNCLFLPLHIVNENEV